jgi:hypothetical protein
VSAVAGGDVLGQARITPKPGAPNVDQTFTATLQKSPRRGGWTFWGLAALGFVLWDQGLTLRFVV